MPLLSRSLVGLIIVATLAVVTPATFATNTFPSSEIEEVFFGNLPDSLGGLPPECPSFTWIVRSGTKICIRFDNPAAQSNDWSAEFKKHGYQFPAYYGTYGAVFDKLLTLFQETACSSTRYGKDIDDRYNTEWGYKYGACFVRKTGQSAEITTELREINGDLVADLGEKWVLTITQVGMPQAIAEPAQKPVKNDIFSDLSETDTHAAAISWLKNNNVFSGYPDGTFRPKGAINRAELLKVLVTGLGVTPPTPSTDCFPDVPKSEWYAPYVCYARDMNWVSGYPDGTFQPAREVNKAEALKMIAGARGMNIGAGSGEWYTPFVQAFESADLLSDTAAVSDNYQRGNVAETLFRAIVTEQSGSSRFANRLYTEMQSQSLQPKTPKKIELPSATPSTKPESQKTSVNDSPKVTAICSESGECRDLKTGQTFSADFSRKTNTPPAQTVAPLAESEQIDLCGKTKRKYDLAKRTTELSITKAELRFGQLQIEGIGTPYTPACIAGQELLLNKEGTFTITREVASASKLTAETAFGERVTFTPQEFTVSDLSSEFVAATLASIESYQREHGVQPFHKNSLLTEAAEISVYNLLHPDTPKSKNDIYAEIPNTKTCGQSSCRSSAITSTISGLNFLRSKEKLQLIAGNIAKRNADQFTHPAYKDFGIAFGVDLARDQAYLTIFLRCDANGTALQPNNNSINSSNF